MATKLITLGQLLYTHEPAVLVKAIDKHGLYGWDEFGVWGSFKRKSETASLALNKLSEVYYAMIEAARHDPPKSWHAVLTGNNLIGPLHHLGWLEGQMPDFVKISKDLKSSPTFMPIESPKMRDETAISIIGSLLHMLVKQPPQGEKKGVISQTNVINHLTSKYGDFPGISKSNLENVFSEANRFIETYTGADAAKKVNMAPKRAKPP